MSSLRTTGSFEHEGVSYEWAVNHFSGSLSAGEKPRPLTARVRLAGVQCKELVIDFSTLKLAPGKLAASHGFERRLQDCVTEALELGWRPDSRGKPFHMEARLS